MAPFSKVQKIKDTTNVPIYKPPQMEKSVVEEFGPYIMPGEQEYLFIDGGCFRAIIDRYSKMLFGEQLIKINYNEFSNIYNKTFYYDALPYKKNNETKSDYESRVGHIINHFNYLRSLRGFHVYEGITRKRRNKPEQKTVDVKIAVDMLMHSFRRNIRYASILTGDLDFKPLIKALVQEGVTVTLLYPFNETNYELRYAADDQICMNLRWLWDNYVDSGFKTENQLPVLHWTRRDTNKISNYVFKENWSSNERDNCEIYTKDDYFILVWSLSPHSNIYGHLYHKELEFLKFAFEEELIEEK